MMCLNCGRWAPADRETGYDADTLCPDCAETDRAEPEPEPERDDAYERAALRDAVDGFERTGGKDWT
jgi:hypothetical protein